MLGCSLVCLPPPSLGFGFMKQSNPPTYIQVLIPLRSHPALPLLYDTVMIVLNLLGPWLLLSAGLHTLCVLTCRWEHRWSTWDRRSYLSLWKGLFWSSLKFVFTFRVSFHFHFQVQGLSTVGIRSKSQGSCNSFCYTLGYSVTPSGVPGFCTEAPRILGTHHRRGRRGGRPKVGER